MMRLSTTIPQKKRMLGANAGGAQQHSLRSFGVYTHTLCAAAAAFEYRVHTHTHTHCVLLLLLLLSVVWFLQHLRQLGHDADAVWEGVKVGPPPRV